MPTKTFTVPAISCGHCVKTIEREVGDLEGVVAVAADQASKRVTVEWTAAGIDWAQIRSYLEEIGYPPEGDHAAG